MTNSSQSSHREIKCDFSVRIDLRTFYLERNAEDVYRCRCCHESTSFSSVVDLLCHNVKTHFESWGFWCSVCMTKLQDLKSVIDHLQIHPILDTEGEKTSDHEDIGSSNFNEIEGASQYSCKNKPKRGVRKKQMLVTRCNICQRNFLYRSAYKKHLETHRMLEEERILCANCGSQFANRRSYVDHKRKNKCRLFPCPQCPKTFIKFSHVNTHYREQHSVTGRVVKCRYCCDILDDTDIDGHCLERHDMGSLHAPLLGCDFCGKSFKNKQILARHVVKHVVNLGAKKSYLCMYCGKTFTMDSSLKLHLRIHTKDYRYTCDLCGERFITKEYLKAHCFKHTGGKRFKCPLCSEAFNHRTTLKNHREAYHMDQLQFKCEKCGDSFETQLGFDRHQKLYSGDCAPICKICNKKFHRNVLKRHELTHTDVKMFACELCPKRFTRKGNLEQHQNVHTGQRPYKCEQCGEAFHNSTTLFVHRMKHQGKQYQAGVKPKVVQCSICGFQYTSQALLNKHLLKTHSVQNDADETFRCAECDYQTTKRANFYAHRWKKHSHSKKQHECSYCGKTFYVKFQLMDHMNRHTETTPHHCPGCSKAFSSRKNMRQHRDKHCPLGPNAKQ